MESVTLVVSIFYREFTGSSCNFVVASFSVSYRKIPGTFLHSYGLLAFFPSVICVIITGKGIQTENG